MGFLGLTVDHVNVTLGDTISQKPMQLDVGVAYCYRCRT